MQQIDFITVVHTEDLPHWRLQARSFAKYAPAGLIRSIIVIANDPSGRASLDYITANLDAYGPHISAVAVKTAAELLAAPERMPGWRSQQALKLVAGAAFGGERLVWLDGKNHFLGAVDFTTFFTNDGRARTIYTAKKRRHDRRWLAHSLKYFGVSVDCIEQPGPLTYTPYPMLGSVLRAMLAEIGRNGDSPEALFRSGKRFTEFYLLYAYVLQQHGAPGAVYDPSLPWPATIWKHGPPTLDQHIERFERLGGPFFALHQNRAGTLLEADREALKRLWLERGLLTDKEADELLGPAAASLRQPSWWRRIGRMQTKGRV